MTDFRKADISKQESYDLLRDWIKLVARHTNPDQDISELLGWLWKLKPATPDPITGLVPCGCGGKAKYIEEYDDDNVFWAHENYVGCPDCYASSAHISTSKHGYSKAMEAEIKLKLKNNWNISHGYTAPPRPGAIEPETDEMAPNGDEGARE